VRVAVTPGKRTVTLKLVVRSGRFSVTERVTIKR
jgi:hypothetical protein